MSERAHEREGETRELERATELAAARVQGTRARAEAAWWRALFDALPVAAVVSNGYGLVRAANEAAARALGDRRGVIVGRSLHALVARSDVRTARAALAELRRVPELSLELRFRASSRSLPFAVDARALAPSDPTSGERAILWTWRDAPRDHDAAGLRTRIASLEAMNAWAAKVIEELAGGGVDAGPFRRERVDLPAVVGRVAAMLGERARARGVAIDVADAPREGAYVTGDVRRLEEMIRVLLSDAVGAAPGGAVVPIAARVDEGSVVLTLRASAAASVASDAIARAIVALHGGAMHGRPANSAADGQGESGERRGTEMTITFPIDAGYEPRYDDDPVTEDDYADLSGIRVVVVEDDADARDMLVDVLATQGAEVRGAGNGADAIALVGDWRPDVLVSDIGLPDMDGYALIRRVRQLGEAGGAVPAIALTGYADIEDSRRALAAGYQVHVAKPIDASLLTHAVANVAGVPIDS